MSQLSQLKLITTLVLVLEKIENENKTKYDTFYSHSKVETLFNERKIYYIFKSIYTTDI